MAGAWSFGGDRSRGSVGLLPVGLEGLLAVLGGYVPLADVATTAEVLDDLTRLRVTAVAVTEDCAEVAAEVADTMLRGGAGIDVGVVIVVHRVHLDERKSDSE